MNLTVTASPFTVREIVRLLGEVDLPPGDARDGTDGIEGHLSLRRRLGDQRITEVSMSQIMTIGIQAEETAILFTPSLGVCSAALFATKDTEGFSVATLLHCLPVDAPRFGLMLLDAAKGHFSKGRVVEQASLVASIADSRMRETRDGQSLERREHQRLKLLSPLLELELNAPLSKQLIHYPAQDPTNPNFGFFAFWSPLPEWNEVFSSHGRFGGSLFPPVLRS